MKQLQKEAGFKMCSREDQSCLVKVIFVEKVQILVVCCIKVL